MSGHEHSVIGRPRYLRLEEISKFSPRGIQALASLSKDNEKQKLELTSQVILPYLLYEGNQNDSILNPDTFKRKRGASN